MKILIVRHGATTFNETHCWQGRIDVPLNDKGVMQAHILGEKLSNIKFGAVFSSPSKRTLETTSIILQRNRHKTPIINTDERLMEIDCGDWEGMSYSSANNGVPDECFVGFLKDPFSFSRIPNGESIIEVCDRTGKFLDELVSNPEYEDQTVLVTTHGCAMCGIIYRVHKNKNDFWFRGIPDNCSVCCIYKESDELKLFLDENSKIFNNKYIINEEIKEEY